MTWTKDKLVAFEQRVADAFLAKQIHAPVHLSGGNEEQLIEVFKDVRLGDWVFSNWRSHYHALLKGIPEQWVWDEIVTGRSMYLMNREHCFFSSSIVGGTLPIAAGVAWSIKQAEYKHQPENADCPLNKQDGIEFPMPDGRGGWVKGFMHGLPCRCKGPTVWVFVGDMTFRTGLFHEFKQLCEGHDLPVKVVVEDNGLSTDTDTKAAWGKHRRMEATWIKHYKYERTWPHVGVGFRVQF